MGSYLSQDPLKLNGGMSLYQYVIDTNSWGDILGLSTVYLRNNEVYVGKTKVNAKTRYSNKSTVTDIFTGIPNTDVAQGVEQHVFERIQVLTNEGKLDPFTNTNNPVNLKDKTKVYRYDDGEKWLKDNLGDNYNDIIDEKIKEHYKPKGMYH